MNEFKSDFQQSDKNFPCFICKICAHTQENSLLCKDFMRRIEKDHETLNTNMQYLAMFGSVKDHLRIT